MKNLIATAAVAFFGVYAHSQEFDWLRSFTQGGGPPRGLTTGYDGDVVVYQSAPSAFYCNDNEVDTLVSGRGFHIANYDSNGVLNWAGVSKYQGLDALEYTVVGCPDGGYFAVGQSRNDPNFDADPGPGVFVPQNRYYPHVFIQKIDENGNLDWYLPIFPVDTFPTSFNPETSDIRILPKANGGFYLTFRASDDVLDMNALHGSEHVVFSNYARVFTSYSAQGEFEWVKSANVSSYNRQGWSLSQNGFSMIGLSGPGSQLYDIDPGSSQLMVEGNSRYLLDFDVNGNLQNSCVKGNNDFPALLQSVDVHDTVRIVSLGFYNQNGNVPTADISLSEDTFMVEAYSNNSLNSYAVSYSAGCSVNWAVPGRLLDVRKDGYSLMQYRGAPSFELQTVGSGSDSVTTGSIYLVDPDGKLVWDRSLSETAYALSFHEGQYTEDKALYLRTYWDNISQYDSMANYNFWDSTQSQNPSTPGLDMIARYRHSIEISNNDSDSISGIDQYTIGREFAFMLYPNPSNGLLFLTMNQSVNMSGHLTLDLIDVNGLQVFTKQLPRRSVHTIPLHGVAAGLYIVRLSDQNGRAFSKRLVVN